jgi:hypothetical protein
MITAGTWYLLPDGVTRVVAVQTWQGAEPDGWRFDSDDDTPLYAWWPTEGMRRLEYDAAIGGMRVVPCDLQFEDLREEPTNEA